MQGQMIKTWGLEPLNMLASFTKHQRGYLTMGHSSLSDKKSIVNLPLHFTYPPVEIISKQLTKLNSKYKERIIYLGPRWHDSVTWNKKFSKPTNLHNQNSEDNSPMPGYYFNQRRVMRNNSFIHDSMKQNRFFKNQHYYRAFEGMNPTLNDHGQVVFQSRFQSGNLDCVVKISQNEYDLFLRIDTNTRGNLFWYHFSLNLPRSSKSPRKVKLNIYSVLKSKNSFIPRQNLKPYVKRTKHNPKINYFSQNWNQGDGISNCNIKQKKLRYRFIYEKVKISVLYELSFELQLNQNEQVSLAYCIPYTYSNLMQEILLMQNSIRSKNIKNIFISSLGESLMGVQIPILIIGNIQDQENTTQRKVIFITGRIHPGESNSSYVISSLINQLCLKKAENVLLSRVLIVIIPMLNPDGVILGNGRTSALGKDLNRQFKSWNGHLNPEVVAVKKLIDKIQQTHEIQIYFDFHGHSKKKNMFFFGPNYSITEPNYYRCRVFPKILSKNLDFFRYFGCSYGMTQSKRTTARAIMINQFNIPFFYTVQTSVGFFHNYLKRQDCPFTRQSLFKIGIKFKQSLKQYFQGIEEYQQYIRGRKRQKISLKNESSSINQKIQSQKQSEPKLYNQDQKVIHLKYIKVFEQIKNEAKVPQKNKVQSSDSDSDSCRSSQQLQPQKMKEFSEMITNYSKIQDQKMSSYSNKTAIMKKQQDRLNSPRKKPRKIQSQLNKDLNLLIRKLTSKNDHRVHLNSISLQKPSQTKSTSQAYDELDCEQKQASPYNQSARFKITTNKKLSLFNISGHNFFKNVGVECQRQKNQKVGIVNFSNMIQYPKFINYSEQGGHRTRAKSRNERKLVIKGNIEDLCRKNEKNKVNNFQLFSQQRDINGDMNQNEGKGITPSNNSKPYPASFYRIKYQSSHKKCRYSSPDKTFSTFTAFKRKSQEFDLDRLKMTKKAQAQRQAQKLFINIKIPTIYKDLQQKLPNKVSSNVNLENSLISMENPLKKKRKINFQ